MMANTYVKYWLLAAFLLPLLGYRAQGWHDFCGKDGVCLQLDAPCMLVVANPNCEAGQEKCCVFRLETIERGVPKGDYVPNS